MSAQPARDRLPSCREVVEIVTSYLEGTMPIDERARFEQHVVWCHGCRVYLDQMREIVRLVGSLSEESIPEHMRDGLVQAFRNWKSQ